MGGWILPCLAPKDFYLGLLEQLCIVFWWPISSSWRSLWKPFCILALPCSLRLLSEVCISSKQPLLGLILPFPQSRWFCHGFKLDSRSNFFGSHWLLGGWHYLKSLPAYCHVMRFSLQNTPSSHFLACPVLCPLPGRQGRREHLRNTMSGTFTYYLKPMCQAWGVHLAPNLFPSRNSMYVIHTRRSDPFVWHCQTCPPL
jgi:hypothetical protein